MIEVRKTDEFDVWLSALTDHKARSQKSLRALNVWRLAIRGM